MYCIHFNLEVSVEPERGFFFMNATKTMSRNSLIEKTLSNLMVVGLHSPCVITAATDLEAKREMDEFVDSCMHKWDSLKARKCITYISFSQLRLRGW